MKDDGPELSITTYIEERHVLLQAIYSVVEWVNGNMLMPRRDRKRVIKMMNLKWSLKSGALKRETPVYVQAA